MIKGGDKIIIGFIGAGKVGFSLGKYFTEKNIKVTGYFSRNQHSANEAANFTNTATYKSIKQLVSDSDTIFITTNDEAIIEVWEQIKTLPITNKVICHCSGSLSSNIFSNISSYGAFGYSIHPMFAISDKFNSYKNLSKAFFTIEGHEKYAQDFIKLFNSLGNKTIIISDENKTLYHAAAVTVSNLVTGLINNGILYLEKCGFSEGLAMEALYPLIQNNIDNIKNQGVINSLTGPVERADIDIIMKHCAVLGDDKELYKMLSKNILKIAEVKNCDKDYKKIKEYLGE